MTKQESVTIQDIADKANVSISTVSRVLNGNTKVGEGYKTAVLQAIEELDYRPNFFAQGLASGHSYTIGVITQNVGSPVYDAILKGILENLSQSNYSPIFADGQWDIDREEHAIETLIAKRVDGLIIVGGSTPTERLISISRQIPLIIVARIVPGLESQCIYMDNYKAGFEATQYLIDQGHRQIAHLSGIHLHQDSQERARGYQDALAQASIVINQDLIIEGDFRRQSGVMGIEMLLTKNEPFTAVFVANDQMAFGARLALFRRGIRVPDDVSLVGFDDQPDSAYMIPPLTTIRQPSVEMGIAAAKAMLDQIANEDSGNAPPVFEGKLIIRESTGRRSLQ